MARRKHEPREAIRGRALSILGDTIREGGTAVEVTLPTQEELLRIAYAGNLRIPRSALHGFWPTREDMIADVLTTTLNSDPYSTATITEQAQTHLARTVGEAAAHTLPRGETRKNVVTGIGHILVSATDHIHVSRLEAVAISFADDEVSAALTTAQENYINTVAGIYQTTHTTLGDQLRGEDDYKDYARRSANFARGLALNPFGISADTVSDQADHFTLLADRYTIPIS